MSDAPAITLGADGTLTANPVYWQPTIMLRWSKAGVLQQAWQSSTGEIAWHDVEREA